MKNISKNTTADIILNSEKLDGFPLCLGKSKGCPLSQLLFFSTKNPTQYKTIKGNKERYIDWEGKINLSLFADDMIVCIENSPRKHQQKTHATNE